jgi:peptidylprolyl isomerase
LRAVPFSAAALIALLAVSAALPGCTGGASDTGTAQVAPAASTAPQLQMTDIKPGTGFTPKPGQTCVVHYTGWLYENGAKGKKFDSSVDRKTPFSFVLGDHKVIEGWERGVSTMKVGGKRSLIIPAALAYGSQGSGAIPANSTLIFEVELLDVRA